MPTQAAAQSAGTGNAFSWRFVTPMLLERGLSGVFFVSGGSEANETAIKLARRHWVRAGQPAKSIVIAHDRGYHGLAGVTTTVTRLAPYHADFGPADHHGASGARISVLFGRRRQGGNGIGRRA